MKKILIWIIPIIILVGVGGYYAYWKINNRPFTPSAPKAVSGADEIKTKIYTNSDHKITMKYPESWKTTDLGGDKNVTEPLLRENIVYLYDPENLENKKDVQSTKVGINVLRFVPENKDINSPDDWFNYVKEKVDDYTGTLGKLNDYIAISVTKTEVDGKWAAVEEYFEPSAIRSRDFYIYNPDKKEFYQLITWAPKDLYDQFLPYFDLIINSFHID